ncbi:MAG TPA: COG1615 family transporter, partial [Deltaproteobacteria bacterium]|nr:COG1615 family transporter [Deltaproteobacteria bacterium]
MVHWKRWLAATVMSITALAGIAIALSFFFSHFLVDIWWFDSVGYEAYFWQRALYRYAVLGSVSIFFFLIFFLNFWVASR